MTGRRYGLVCAVVALAAPGAAGASTVEIHPDPQGMTLAYSVADGETSSVSVARDRTGAYVIADTSAAIVAGAGCTLVDATHASCMSTRVQRIDVMLADGDDTATIDDSAYPPGSPLLGGVPVTVAGGDGHDTITGGAGSDDLSGGPGADILHGGGGQDALSGDEGDDQLYGDGGAEFSISGGDGDDTLRGGPGDDNGLSGNAGDDKVYGDEGDDDLSGNAGDDKLYGGPGDDRLEVADEFEPDPTPGHDVLDGGAGDDTLGGGSGRALSAGDGLDTFIGGDGTDTADFGLRTAPLSIGIDGVADDGQAGERDDVYEDVENVVGGSEGDRLVGSAVANHLDGRAGDDTIDGHGGNDRLDGGAGDAGSDTLTGGDGSDTIDGGPGDDEAGGGDGADVIAGGGGADTLEGDADADTIAGGAGIDALDGGGGNDTLNGGGASVGADGRDNVKGGPGDDRLFGDEGDDVLDGGPGADDMRGGPGRDTVTYEDRDQAVIVTFDELPNDGEEDPPEGDDVHGDIEIVLGGAVGDTLTGGPGGSDLEGGSGQDLVAAGSGRSRLSGGNGSDVLRARDGRAEVVACGDDTDLAIIDRRDTPRDCETVDRGGARGPRARRYVILRPARTFALRLHDGTRWFSLPDDVRVPIDSTVDAADGPVALQAARNAAGGRQTATVEGGAFRIRQTTGRRPLTTLRLAGEPLSCAASSARHDRPPRTRSLAVDAGHGRWRVSGRYSDATTQGTRYSVEERCDGTLTTVVEGAVRVRDLGRRRTVLLRPGQSYLAAPPRERR